jgi:hypothetical protein
MGLGSRQAARHNNLFHEATLIHSPPKTESGGFRGPLWVAPSGESLVCRHAGAGKAPLFRVSKVSSPRGSAFVRFLGKAEIVGPLDGHFLCDFEDLANDVEIVLLRFFVDTAGRKSSDHGVMACGLR